MSKSLLDLMSTEDKEKAIARGRKRLEKAKGSAISPEMYVIAEFGYYFGFEGILAIKRGYIEYTDAKGSVVKEPFTLDEVLALLEAAKKVWYSKVIDSAHGTMVASASKYAKQPGEAFKGGMQPYIDKADLNGGEPKPKPGTPRNR